MKERDTTASPNIGVSQPSQSSAVMDVGRIRADLGVRSEAQAEVLSRGWRNGFESLAVLIARADFRRGTDSEHSAGNGLDPVLASWTFPKAAARFLIAAAAQSARPALAQSVCLQRNTGAMGCALNMLLHRASCSRGIS